MKTKRSLRITAAGLGALACLACAANRLETGPARAVDWDTNKIEAFLKSARIVNVRKDAEEGRTMPWVVSLDDGTTQGRAIFKYLHRPRPADMADSFKYDIAAYELSRLLDLEIVPPTIERQVEGRPGALQWFLEGCLSERDRERTKLQPPDLKAFRDRLDEIIVFEALTKEECQDKDDILIHPDTWKICRVDFSEAFNPAPVVEDSCVITRCSRHLFDHLQKSSRSALANRLRPYLNDQELDGLWARQRRIVTRLQTLIKEKGERAVIF